MVFATALASIFLGPVPVWAVPANSPPRVLILDEMVYGGTNSQEALAAQLAIPGCAVDLVSATNWPAIPATGTGGPTGFGFDHYRAIILGDPMCEGLPFSNRGTATPEYFLALTVLNATKAIWTPVVTGNVILEGVDNALHASVSVIGADKTLKRGIGFAVNDTNRTGLYYALSCYYDYTAPATNATLVPHLTGFGTFMVRNYQSICFDDAHIVATHPVFTASPPLTDVELSSWGCSTHEGFNVWPPTFVVLAIALTNGAYTATDGSNGVPYILVRGEGVKVISTIDLNPPLATNKVGTTHTVCATLATNVIPNVGAPVTFTIVSGPNSVTNYTTVTDSNRVACFTYTGIGGPGVDYITASYITPDDKTITSGTVAKIWEGTCVGVGCENLECQADGTWTYQLCVTNLGSGPIASISLSNPPAGVTITPGSISLTPALNAGQSTTVTVTIGSAGGPTSFCFLLGGIPASVGELPCVIPHCITLPACCNRVITNQLIFSGTSGTTNTYNYQITIQNVTGNPLKYVGFAADQACVSFLPTLVNLTLPAYGGPSLLFPSQTRSFTVQVQKATPCPGTNAVYLSTYTTNLIACCSTKLYLPPARCVYLVSPYDGSVVLTNTTVLAKAIPNPVPIGLPCGFGVVMFYQDTVLVGVADRDPYEAHFAPAVPGVYNITAVAMSSTGELETSDAATLTVLAPGPAHDQDHQPPSLTAGVTGSDILLNVATASGHHYMVQYRTNLASGDWLILQSFDGDGSTKVITDSVTNDASRFYRAVRLP